MPLPQIGTPRSIKPSMPKFESQVQEKSTPSKPLVRKLVKKYINNSQEQ